MTGDERRKLDEMVAAVRRGERVPGVLACGPFGGEPPGQNTDPWVEDWPAQVGEEDQSQPGWDA